MIKVGTFILYLVASLCAGVLTVILCFLVDTVVLGSVEGFMCGMIGMLLGTGVAIVGNIFSLIAVFKPKPDE